MRRLVPRVMLFLLAMSMLTLALEMRTARAEGTIFINADGSITPVGAPISTFDNVIYTLTDNVSESIVVLRSNIMVDGAGYTVQGSGSGNGVNLEWIDNVTIEHIAVKGFSVGVLFSYSNNSVASSCDMENNGFGIELGFSSNNSICGNNITTNTYYNILLIESSNNTITRNTIASGGIDGVHFEAYCSDNSVSENNIANNGFGIRLWSSINNVILGNNITSNSDAGIDLTGSTGNVLRNNSMVDNPHAFGVDSTIGVDSSGISDYLNDVDASNTVNGKPICYLIGQHNMQAPTYVGYLALVNCSSITVQNMNLTNNEQGILLAYTTNSTITQNNMTNNLIGIQLRGSSNCSILRNEITSNDLGVQLSSSNNIDVSENDITGNGNGTLTVSRPRIYVLPENALLNGVLGYGIYLSSSSSSNSISGNIIGSNGGGWHLVLLQ